MSILIDNWSNPEFVYYDDWPVTDVNINNVTTYTWTTRPYLIRNGKPQVPFYDGNSVQMLSDRIRFYYNGRDSHNYTNLTTKIHLNTQNITKAVIDCTLTNLSGDIPYVGIHVIKVGKYGIGYTQRYEIKTQPPMGVRTTVTLSGIRNDNGNNATMIFIAPFWYAAQLDIFNMYLA